MCGVIKRPNAETVDAVLGDLVAESPQRDLFAVPGDVTNESDTDSFLSAIECVDVLVNNPGPLVLSRRPRLRRWVAPLFRVGRPRGGVLDPRDAKDERARAGSCGQHGERLGDHHPG